MSCPAVSSKDNPACDATKHDPVEWTLHASCMGSTGKIDASLCSSSTPVYFDGKPLDKCSITSVSDSEIIAFGSEGGCPDTQNFQCSGCIVDPFTDSLDKVIYKAFNSDTCKGAIAFYDTKNGKAVGLGCLPQNNLYGGINMSCKLYADETAAKKFNVKADSYVDYDCHSLFVVNNTSTAFPVADSTKYKIIDTIDSSTIANLKGKEYSISEDSPNLRVDMVGASITTVQTFVTNNGQPKPLVPGKDCIGFNLENTKLDSIGKTLEECLEQCVTLQNCGGVSYDATTKRCAPKEAGKCTKDTTTSTNGYQYYDMSQFLKNNLYVLPDS